MESPGVHGRSPGPHRSCCHGSVRLDRIYHHRLLEEREAYIRAHADLRRPRAFAILTGCLGFQGSIRWWVLRHRLHHRQAPSPFSTNHLSHIVRQRLKLTDLLIASRSASPTTPFMTLTPPREVSSGVTAAGSSSNRLTSE
jgi:hypothetical protein